MKNFITILAFTFISLRSFSQVPNTLTANDKLYGLSKFWQEVNYNFVYLDKTDRVLWENTYKELIGKVQLTKNDYEYYRELQRFCALLKDGHTKVYFPEKIESALMRYDFGPYRLFTDYLDDKIVITGINVSKKEEVPVGSEIIEINGQPVKEYTRYNVKPFIAVSSPYVLEKEAARNIFLGLEGDAYDVKIKKPGGTVLSLKLVHSKAAEREIFPKLDGKPAFESRWLNKETFYVALNSFENAAVYNDFLAQLQEMKKAKSLIIDVRLNGGGSSAISKKIARHLIEGNIMYGPKSQSRMHIPTDKAIGSFLTAQDTAEGKTAWGLTKEQTINYYNTFLGSRYFTYDYAPDTIKNDVEKIIVPTIVLTGNSTASAAEDFLVFTDGQKHITRIGEYTNGSTGQPMQIDLPGEGSAWICTKKVTFGDGREFVGMGIKPAIEMKYSLKDYLNNEDATLKKAIEILNKK